MAEWGEEESETSDDGGPWYSDSPVKREPRYVGGADRTGKVVFVVLVPTSKGYITRSRNPSYCNEYVSHESMWDVLKWMVKHDGLQRMQILDGREEAIAYLRMAFPDDPERLHLGGC